MGLFVERFLLPYNYLLGCLIFFGLEYQYRTKIESWVDVLGLLMFALRFI